MSDKKVVLPASAVDAMNLAAQEFHEIHALMDAGEVPREFNGEKLSAAQRVRWFFHTREAANAAINLAAKKKTKH
jgi:hypothetical protein